MMAEWATRNAWKMRPLRAMGPRSWLIGARDDPPKSTLDFNVGHRCLPVSSKVDISQPTILSCLVLGQHSRMHSHSPITRMAHS